MSAAPLTKSDHEAITSLHWGMRVEAAANRLVRPLLWRLGWRPKIVPYVGYGNSTATPQDPSLPMSGGATVRILARVLLAPPGTTRRDIERGRGWRRFLAITAPGVSVTIEAGGRTTLISTAHGGYIDAVIEADLAPGWTQVRLACAGSAPADAPVRVVGTDESFGVITDIDDTIIVTTLPRPLVAFWNTFVKREFARRPVPGIAEMLRAAVAAQPDALVVYVSTGAWNVAPAIEAFLARHGMPRGPMLLSDWGPAPDRWFRSGTEHKQAQLNRLMHDLPRLHWLLVGDDGQHDPQLYTELARAYPDRVRAVAIRELTPAQQLLSHGTPQPIAERSEQPEESEEPVTAVEVRGADGHALLAALRERRVIRRQLRE